jgi:hypothetical protein
MPRRILKRLLPDHQAVRNSKYLRVFGSLLHHPHLWHLNRRAVAGAFSLGLFTAFIPLPSQMALAAAGAIVFRVNLPVAVSLVWLTNPVTIPPLYYFAYKLGAWLLAIPPRETEFEFSLSWFSGELAATWQPFLLGSLVLGTVSATLGYFAVRTLWRLHVVRHWRLRRWRRQVHA